MRVEDLREQEAVVEAVLFTMGRSGRWRSGSWLRPWKRENRRRKPPQSG